MTTYTPLLLKVLYRVAYNNKEHQYLAEQLNAWLKCLEFEEYVNEEERLLRKV